MSSRRIGAALIGCALALAATACGSSSGSGSANGSTNGGKGPIVIGFIGSESGVFQATFGLGAQVIQAWQSSVNASGGINGHPVRVITEDDAGNDAQGLQVAKQLFEQDHVMAVVGESSGVTAWASYLETQGVPVIGGYSVSSVFLNNPDAFPIGATADYFSYGLISELASQGDAQKLGLAYCAESPVCQLSPSLDAAISVQHAPVRLVRSISISATAPNFTAACLSFQQAGVKALNVSDQSSIIQEVAANCMQQNYRPVQAQFLTGYTPSWLKDPNLNGALIVSPNAFWGDKAVPGAVAYMDALKKYAPSVAASPNLYLAEFTTWLGAKLFQAAAQAGNIGPTSTAQDVKNALYKLHGETLGGAAPPLTFTPGSATQPPCWFAYTIKNGTMVAMNGSKPACASASEASAFQQALK
jgi:branched-chain amino acid transport system substrate-binding protein